MLSSFFANINSCLALYAEELLALIKWYLSLRDIFIYFIYFSFQSVQSSQPASVWTWLLLTCRLHNFLLQQKISAPVASGGLHLLILFCNDESNPQVTDDLRLYCTCPAERNPNICLSYSATLK